ncbi:MAG: cupin domain-containing protein [Gammaproteobacteria bacterium]|nr:cupin domain-containing protein [Gammaproteobacteria bacterium]
MSATGAIRVHYRLACAAAEAPALARRIAYEQTVELPEALVDDPNVLAQVLGVVEDVREFGDHTEAVIRYHGALANGQLSQLLILLFGNVSLFPGVRIVALDLPDDLLDQFEGPRYGCAGLRDLLGVFDRPLLATALKPRGRAVADLAALAGAFARGGGDIVKDDQNLADDAAAFAARVRATARAVADANAATGRNCLYFPHVSAPDTELEARFALIARLGLKGVLACPLILGLERTRRLARDYGVLLMAHPALAGGFTNGIAEGIAPEILLGTLFRLCGADISVFPSYGGRFSFSRQTCMALRARLTEPLGHMRASVPAPAGGMHFDDLRDLCTAYGPDTVFLIGGSLLGHDPDLERGTRAFLDRIRALCGERLDLPATGFVSACELPGTRAGVQTLLPFRGDYSWGGRNSAAYKTNAELPFAGVRRVELIGTHGEQTAFDLRYFELEPGGHTSLERHVHTHVIIAVRGAGVLRANGGEQPLRPFDVAYVAPLDVHQLRNDSAEPFGFFCIVDHERDRPRAP